MRVIEGREKGNERLNNQKFCNFIKYMEKTMMGKERREGKGEGVKG